MKTNKRKLLCVDFEFQNEIYNPISYHHTWLDVVVVNQADKALTLLEKEKYDFLITTIVMPGGTTGLELIDKVQKDSKKYGNPKIAILTGLGGDKFYKEVIERQVDLIDRYERQVKDIEEDIDLFLKGHIHEVEQPFPKDDVVASMNDSKLQKEIKKPSLLQYHHPINCSECKGNNFEWIRFVSPDYTWKALCGRDCWLLICKDCKKQYEQIIRILN